MLRKTQEIEANVEGAELMSFRVLWFVVAGFVIGFTTSTLWEWLYYRRKRLAMLAEHSDFVRDAERRQGGVSHAQETATSDATEWRPPFYRSPGVFLESEQPGADATFTGTAFTPSAAPWVAPPPATVNPATQPAATAPLDEAEDDGPLFPGQSYRGSMGVTTAGAIAPSNTTDSRLPFSVRPPVSSLTNDEVASADQVQETQPAAAPTNDAVTTFSLSTVDPRADYANVIIVDQVTSDDGQHKAATPAEESSNWPVHDQMATAPCTTNTAEGTPAAVPTEKVAATAFDGVELTAPAPVAVTPQMAELPVPPVMGKPTAHRPHERTPRERPDDYPDDLALIKGIGEAYKRRLYATGIYTWHQVAANDLDSLRRITRAKPNADIQSWQTQARELAEKYQRWEAHFVGPLDDLTQIDGIGAITADMLYKAGICTYGALAQTSPDELARIVPAPTVGNENDFEGWIREAARLDGVKRKNQGLLS